MTTMIFLTSVLLFFQVTKGDFLEPLVHWSMDLRVGAKLMPDYGNETRFSVGFPTSRRRNYFTTGIIGDGLALSSRKMHLIRNLRTNNCLRDPMRCKDGLSIAFWLYLKKLTRASYQVILRSTYYDGSGPGVYIGGDRNPSMMKFLVRTGSGVEHSRKIPWSEIKMKWCHFSLNWNSSYGIQVFLNGSATNNGQDIIQGNPISHPGRSDFTAGDFQGPVFLLDDLWIFSHSLTEDDIQSLYALGLSELNQPPSDLKTSNVTTEYNYSIFTTHSGVFSSSEKPSTVDQEEKTSSFQMQLTTSGVSSRTNSVSLKHKVTSTNSIVNTESASVTSVRYEEDSLVTISRSLQETSTELTTNPAIVGVKKPTPPPRTQPRRTPYTGWFYNQTWYHVMVGAALFIMLAILAWLCVVHCLIPTSKNPAKSNKQKVIIGTETEPFI